METIAHWTTNRTDGINAALLATTFKSGFSPANDWFGVLASGKRSSWTGSGYDRYEENGAIPGVAAADRYRHDAGLRSAPNLTFI